MSILTIRLDLKMHVRSVHVQYLLLRACAYTCSIFIWLLINCLADKGLTVKPFGSRLATQPLAAYWLAAKACLGLLVMNHIHVEDVLLINLLLVGCRLATRR